MLSDFHLFLKQVNFSFRQVHSGDHSMVVVRPLTPLSFHDTGHLVNWWNPRRCTFQLHDQNCISQEKSRDQEDQVFLDEECHLCFSLKVLQHQLPVYRIFPASHTPCPPLLKETLYFYFIFIIILEVIITKICHWNQGRTLDIKKKLCPRPSNADMAVFGGLIDWSK